MNNPGLAGGPNNPKKKSMFGVSLFNESPKPQTNTPTQKENLRSLLINFNHTNKSDDDKINNISVLLEKVISLLGHATAAAIIDSQLDCRGLIALVMKAVKRFSPKDPPTERILVPLQLVQAIEVIVIFCNANHDQFWSILEQSKALVTLIGVLKTMSSIEGLGKKYNQDEISANEALAKAVNQGLKMYLKKEPNYFALVIKHVTEIGLKPMTLMETKPGCWRKTALKLLSFYFKSKKFVQEQMEQVIANDQFKQILELFDESMGILDLEYPIILLDLIMGLLNATHLKHDIYIQQFEACGGHELIFNLLVKAQEKENQTILLDSLFQLASLGSKSIFDNIEDVDCDSPFQQPSFLMPVALDDFQFRNKNVLDIYLQCYRGKRDDGTPLPSQLCFAAVEQVLQIVQINPINYFAIVGNSNIIYTMVEHIDEVGFECRQVTLAILKHVILVLGYVPYKELSLLFSHFHGFSSSDTVELVTKTFVMILESNNFWRVTFQELGLVVTLSSLVLYLEKDIKGGDTPDTWEGGKFNASDAIKRNFEIIMGLLDELVRNNEQNLQLFRDRASNAIFSLLQRVEYSTGAILIIKNLIMKASQLEGKDQQFELGQLISAAKSSRQLKAASVLAVLLGELLNGSCSIQNSFLKLKGFEGLFTMLFLVEIPEVQAPTDCHNAFLKNWALVLFNALNQNLETKRYLAEKISSLPALEAFRRHLNPDNCQFIVSIILAVVTEDKEYIFNKGKWLDETSNLDNGIFLPALLELLSQLSEQYNTVVLATIKWIVKISGSSIQNKVTLANCGILVPLVQWLSKAKNQISFSQNINAVLTDPEDKVISAVVALAKQSIMLGVNNEELRLCLTIILSRQYVNLSFKSFIQDLILETIKFGRSPSYFHFEPKVSSASGRLFIEDYGRTVPPQSGYSFLGWFQVPRLDENFDIPLLSIADQGGIERLNIYIGKGTPNLIIKTKNTVILGNYEMPQKCWVHLGFVHHKPMLLASTIDFYVNGAMVFSEKCSYLGHPASMTSIKTYIGSFSTGVHPDANYVLLIGPTYFIGEHLIDAQSLAIIYDIGFEYAGNWQGSWAAYLVGNKNLQKRSNKLIEEEGQSPIFNQLATFAMSPSKSHQSYLLEIPEDCFWFSLSAQNSVENLPRYAKQDLLESNQLSEWNNFGSSWVINGGSTKPGAKSNLIKIEGYLISVRPKRMIEGIWTIGGCGILLRLVEDSDTSEEFHKNLTILVGCVNNSWRNLAEMERGQMYELLSFILKSKKELITIASLDVIMSLVGKNIDNSNDAIISNPNALRHLVLDIELWRSSIEIQKYYLNQLTDLIVHSPYKDENINTLNKMASIKRMILMFENQIIDQAVVPDLVQHMKILLKGNWNHDIIKTICTFLINTLPKPDNYQEIKRDQHFFPRISTGESWKDRSVCSYTVYVRNVILSMLTEIIVEKENNAYYGEDFVQAVTVRWIYLFLSPRLGSGTIVIAARLLYAVWITIDYPGSRFVEGFSILQQMLQSRFNVVALYHPLLAILCATVVNEDYWKATYNTEQLVETLKASKHFRKGYCVDVIPAILGMVSNCVRSMLKKDKKNEEKETASEKESRMASLLGLAQTAQTTLTFLGTMFLESEQMKEALSTQDIIDELFSIMFSLISKDPIMSIDHGLDLLKKEPVSELSAFHEIQRVKGQRNLKLFLIFQTVDKSWNGVESRFLLSPSHSKYHLHSEITSLHEDDNHLRQTIDALLEIVMIVTVESILEVRRPLQGLEFILKAIPACANQTRLDFQEFVLTCTINAISQKLRKHPNMLQDLKIQSNLYRLVALLTDSLNQGVFSSDPSVLLDFSLFVTVSSLAFEEEANKNSPKYSHEYSQQLKQLNRITLVCLGRIAEAKYAPEPTCIILMKIKYYENVTLNHASNNAEYCMSLMHHLYRCSQSEHQEIQLASLEVWRSLLSSKPVIVAGVFKTFKGDYQKLLDGFSQSVEGNGPAFQTWLSQNNSDLGFMFWETVTKCWEEFVTFENRQCKDTASTSRKNDIQRLKRKKKKTDINHQIFIKFSDKARTWISESQAANLVSRQKFKADYKLMQSSLELEWRNLLVHLGQENSILAVEKTENRWKLDFTEAKARMRKKFRKNIDNFIAYQSKAEKILENMSPSVPELESVPVQQQITSPTLPQESFNSVSTSNVINSESVVGESISNTLSTAEILNTPSEIGILSAVDDDEEELDLVEKETPSEGFGSVEKNDDWEELNLEENQNMKIQRLLQPGDSIIEIVNCARLVGLELIEGIVLICQQNIYLVDNYFKGGDGEIVDLHDVLIEDRNIYHLIVTEPNWKHGEALKTKAMDESRHTYRECSYIDIKEVHKRLYLFRNVALEMFLSDGRNFFLSFWTNKIRDAVYNRLLAKSQINTTESVAGVSNAAGQSVLQNALFGGSPLNELTQKWQSREISNLAYLMHLNTLAGRSYNDLTQYPIFPWVLSDYESETLDLENPNSFRNFSLPMGGQGSERAKQFEERFSTWDDPALPGCHYGTHYSSSMIVCNFLIRVEPFTEQYLKLQGGHFDHPDRIFHSVPTSWASASRLNTTDVRELIPEFFYLPDFLENQNKFNFGKKQTGETIDQVVLPPWAKGNARLFVKLHRQALESEYVSQNIHNWIDLIFGYKQQGEEAAKSLNVFHYLSYEGAVDMDKITDPVEKQSTISIIHNFGQTPKQLLKKPHPKRSPILQEYRIDKSFQALIPSTGYIRNLNGPQISDVYYQNNQLLVVGPKKIFLPGNSAKYLEWGNFDHSIRIFQTNDQKRLAVFESLHIGQISTCSFVDSDILVTGGLDMTVCVWNFVNGKKPSLDLKACMRGHREKITSLASSRSFSLIVSGSDDCTAIIWDLNRTEYTHTLTGHKSPIICVAINQNCGDIITCDKFDLGLWDVNGVKIAFKNAGLNDPISSVLPYEGKGSESFDTDMIFTGHASGVIKLWKKTFSQDSWQFVLARQLDCISEELSITFLACPSPGKFLLSGDSKGRLLGWMLPDSGTEIHYVSGDQCQSCRTKLAVITRKVNCKSCGGLHCTNCISTNSGISRCQICSQKLEKGNFLSPVGSQKNDGWTLI